MRWFFRPSVLTLVSAGLAAAAVVLVLWPGASANQALPRPLEPGDREVVWLYAATNAAPWERFVTAVDHAAARWRETHPGQTLEVNSANAFPDLTTTVPELSVAVKGRPGRLWFRWYKLTGDLKTDDWVRALLARRPAPLAIIGGSSSDLAIDLARSLNERTADGTLGQAAPLLLLTSATADDVVTVAGADEEPGPPEGPLTGVYGGRTFRFCFTNRQMAAAVTAFLWSQEELRPDTDPLYLTYWVDDPYSKDLNRSFCDVLRNPAARAAARDWAFLAGFVASGGLPLDARIFWRGFFRADTPVYARLPYSVGSFAEPNRWEVEEAWSLMRVKLGEYPLQRRPLLVVPAASQPTRRFLRALIRTAPAEARRFIVATGDALAFNVVYRDRNMAWPIQDLPFHLVLFCHRNPVDRDAGFRPEEEASTENRATGHSSTAGTEDLLLFADIADALLEATCSPGVPTTATELAQKLRQARWSEKDNRLSFDDTHPRLFDEDGNRRSGTGEHIVYLRPVTEGEVVLPDAELEVWSWKEKPDSERREWRRRDRLPVHYEGSVGLENNGD
jgi:hypothetical protein